MSVRRIGTWKDSLRRRRDAAIACLLPGGLPIAPILAQVDGYLFPHEGVFLYWMARSGPGSGCVVEIGSFRGRSTLCMAAGVSAGRKTRVFAVDPHVYETAQELGENLRHFGLETYVDSVVLPSVEVAGQWREPVRLLFIDGNHEKESVEADVRTWLPHLEPGGFLVLHDSTSLSGFPGPIEVAKTTLRPGPIFDAVGELGSITWGRRAGATAPWSPPTYGKAILDAALRAKKGLRGAKSDSARPS